MALTLSEETRNRISQAMAKAIKDDYGPRIDAASTTMSPFLRAALDAGKAETVGTLTLFTCSGETILAKGYVYVKCEDPDLLLGDAVCAANGTVAYGILVINDYYAYVDIYLAVISNGELGVRFDRIFNPDDEPKTWRQLFAAEPSGKTWRQLPSLL